MDTYPQTSFPTIGTVIILQGTDDFVIGVGHGEGAGQRASGRHGAYTRGIRDPGRWSEDKRNSTKRSPGQNMNNAEFQNNLRTCSREEQRTGRGLYLWVKVVGITGNYHFRLNYSFFIFLHLLLTS